jgi:hypothetical protein
MYDYVHQIVHTSGSSKTIGAVTTASVHHKHYGCAGAADSDAVAVFSRRSSGVMGNPDLQLRTDSLGLTPLLAPLSPLPPVRIVPQPYQPRRRLQSSGGSGDGLVPLSVEVAAFDRSSSNDSLSSMTGRHDSKLIGEWSF